MNQPSPKARTASYVRVSSKAADLSTQRHAIAAEYPDGVAREYAEKLSAKTTQRAALQQLLADARAGRFDRLVTFALDRLTRSGVADTFAVVEELRRSGVTLHCIRERLVIRPDADDVTSTVLVFAFGLAAKLERQATNERIAAARVRLQARGQGWGRPKKHDARSLQHAVDLRAQGVTVRAIADELGLSMSTVNRMLRPAR